MSTRVLLAHGLPRMLHELLVELARSRAELEVDESAHSRQEIRGRIGGPRPQVLVLRREGADLPDWATELLDHNPRLRFLSLDSEGRSGDVFDLRLAHRRIDAISPDALLAALGDPSGEPRRWPPGIDC